MAVKGTETKKYIADKILSTFDGSFLCNGGKEIRIPGTENGELVQIKIALTCAKTNIESGDENKLPGETVEKQKVVDAPVEISQEEKNNVQKMLDTLSKL